MTIEMCDKSREYFLFCLTAWTNMHKCCMALYFFRSTVTVGEIFISKNLCGLKSTFSSLIYDSNSFESKTGRKNPTKDNTFESHRDVYHARITIQLQCLFSSRRDKHTKQEDRRLGAHLVGIMLYVYHMVLLPQWAKVDLDIQTTIIAFWGCSYFVMYLKTEPAAGMASNTIRWCL